MIVKRLLNDF